MGAKKIILSGMRPTGKLHLGHLFGALKNWVKLQDEHDCLFFVADWHALTTDYADTSKLKENIVEMVIDWLSCGLDPDKSVIFQQSQVKEHAELCLLLGMVVPLPWLERCPTYKEQQEALSDRMLATYGFLGYPLLQTADILIYKADGVPVGIDQVPHIELSREIARRFNNFYGEVFVLPEPILTEMPKIPGTDGRKMSKSYNNAILLSDFPEEVDRKVKTMVTDPARKRRIDAGNPEICPVFALHKVYTRKDVHEWVIEGCTTTKIGCLDCKKPLIEAINSSLEPIRKTRQQLERDKKKIAEILVAGSNQARERAQKTMQEVRVAMRLQ